MRLIKSVSGKIVLLLFFIFSLSFGEKISNAISNKQTCVCAYDGYGYYLYLPHLFEKGNLDITQEWAQQLQDKYCDGLYAYQVVHSKYGADLAVYHMGLAILQLPAYTLGDITARIGGFETDGFSTPYHITYLLNALLFIFLGLLYLRKLLLLFFNEKVSALLIAVTFLASNAYATLKIQHDLTHLYLFALNAIFLFHLFKFTKTNVRKHLLYSAIILGLTSCIRPTQALWGIIPFLILLKHFGHNKSFWKNILLYPLFAIIWNIPQFLYWKLIGGHWFIPNLHTEDIILTDPNLLDFLFSYKKGWLIYSPVFILITLGFRQLYKKNRRLFWASLSFTILYIYIMSSWECWWYAGSFGSRVMVDIYPVLAIPLGSLLISLNNKWSKILTGAFVTGCIILNLFQTHQLELGILHHSRMTKNQYWYIFGRQDIQPYVDHHLEIDRWSQNFSWKENSKQYPDLYAIEERELFSIAEPKTFSPGNDMTVTHINLLKALPTDESMLHVELTTSTSDPTKQATLQMETCSKYNCYDWKTIELSQGTNADSTTRHELTFNLTNIRHNSDWMQLYIYSPEETTITIHSMSVKGTSLIRK